jgi:hypothetical protein
LEEVYEALQSTAVFPTEMMEVDYDVYAEGEAELGWLNATANLTAEEAFSLDEFTLGLVDGIRDRLLSAGAEPAHLKVLTSTGGDVSVANLVSSDSETMLSMESGIKTGKATTIINARVCSAPESLQQLVTEVLNSLASEKSIVAEIEQIESFRPGRPVPTHRVTATS